MGILTEYQRQVVTIKTVQQDVAFEVELNKEEVEVDILNECIIEDTSHIRKDSAIYRIGLSQQYPMAESSNDENEKDRVNLKRLTLNVVGMSNP